MNVEKIREEFPILKRKVYGKQLVYLDNAATTQKPRQVTSAITDFYENYNSNIHRAVHKLSQEATQAYDEAHEKVARFIGASGMEEIVFTKNTTESLNVVAGSLSKMLSKGDEILLTQMEHHSNIVPWQQAAKRTGAKIRYAEINRNGELDLDQIHDLISKKTRIVAFTHASNVLGTITPASEIIRMAKDAGATTVVDAAQSVPQMPISVKKLGCDFLAFSGHKMLGPMGVGVLYGREDMLNSIDPFLFGGDMISEVSFEDAKWNDLPWKFEAGTPNVAGGIGLGTAIDYLKAIGMEEVHENEKKLVKAAMEKLSTIDGLTIYGPPASRRTGLVSFGMEGVHTHDVSALLDAQGIAVRGGHHCAMPLAKLLGVGGTTRASFYVYNTTEEIGKLADSLKDITAKMKKMTPKAMAGK